MHFGNVRRKKWWFLKSSSSCNTCSCTCFSIIDLSISPFLSFPPSSFHYPSLHYFFTALILPSFWFVASPLSLLPFISLHSSPSLPPSLSPMPLLSSVAVAKTGRCAAITLIGCDFFIYMTSTLQSWEPTACSLHPAAALVSLGPVVL